MSWCRQGVKIRQRMKCEFVMEKHDGQLTEPGGSLTICIEGIMLSPTDKQKSIHQRLSPE